MVIIKNITRDYGTTAVEDFALTYYAEQGFQGIKSQNEYWWTIMSLLFWNVIFAKVEGALNPDGYNSKNYIFLDDSRFTQMFDEVIRMNGMPLDFFTENFFQNRVDIIINRYKELQRISLDEEIKKSYQVNYGKYCRPIENWDKFTLENLTAPLSSIKKEVVLRICLKLLQDFTNNRSGLPDILVYKNSSCVLVEVKSANDKISDRQVEWAKFLSLDLKQNVEILLVNQTDRKATATQKKFNEIHRKVTISFGKSSSVKYEEAVSFFKTQSSYRAFTEGKEELHEATFDFFNTENLIRALDLTTRWKSLDITVDGEKATSTIIRNSLWCYRSNTDNWDIENVRYSYGKTYGCDNITTPVSTNFWRDFGYIDTNAGEWVFDKEKIRKNIEIQIGENRYCPYLDVKNIEKDISKIQERVNPQFNKDWAFLDDTSTEWYFRNNKWQTSYSDRSFPGISQMVSIRNIKNERRYSYNETNEITVDITPTISPTSNNKIISSKKSGCSPLVIWSIRIILFFTTYGISAIIEIAFRLWLRNRRKNK